MHCLATGVRTALSPPVPVVTVIDYPSGLLSNLQHHIVYMSRSLKCCSINLETINLHLALSIISHYLAYVATDTFPLTYFHFILKVYNIHFFVFSRVQGFHLDLVYDVVLSGNGVMSGIQSLCPLVETWCQRVEATYCSRLDGVVSRMW